MGAGWCLALLEQEESCGCWRQGPGEPLEGANRVLWVWMLRGKVAVEGLGWLQSCAPPPPWGQQVLAWSCWCPESPQELRGTVQRQPAFMAGRSMLAVLYAALSWQLEAGAWR